MSKYHKINTIYKRDMEAEGRNKPLLEGEWSLDEFRFLSECKWEWTEKVDGMNIRVIFDEQGMRYAGKTDKAQIPAALIDGLNKIFDPFIQESIKEDFPDGVIFYGEGYGPKIQKIGGLYRENQSFVVFDIRVGRWWMKRSVVEYICEKLGLKHVPIVGSGTLSEAVEYVRKGFTSTCGDFRAEG